MVTCQQLRDNCITAGVEQMTGAVLVVGGGIAGMQASLDLADQGFRVYLVEVESAIGGKMAQLDKTFPTNDCAMCTISPKLVEVGRHPNIELLTNSEVLEVQGVAGDFTARIRRKPRYIDPEKCVACDDCAKVCPVIVPNRFNEGISQNHAIYKLYPQAVPNAYAIEKRGIAPCRDACPAGQRVQGYIALIREGRWEDALRVIKMDNPFPGICGRVCNHRCEDACNRGQVDEPINIRALKRFVTDKVYAKPRQPVTAIPCQSDQRVAIIGSGPCGLTAAQDLALAGYRVTVFEAMPVAGGMLRLGIPEYRLPAEIIEREVQDILDLGVDIRLNYQVDNLDDIFHEGFDAVLVAVGAHEGIRLPIPGARLPGVLVNTHFLRDVRLGRYNDPASRAQLGQRVLVLGGGDVAIDCARSAVRLGCTVHLACVESYEKMPAQRSEIQEAEEEGVVIHPSQSFERILEGTDGHACGVECQDVASFSFDERGRLTVEKIPNSLHTTPCNTVIFSVGQRAGLAFIPEDANVGLTDRQTIAVNPNTFATSRAGVFAAGDCTSGTAFVIEAVARGHTAAQSILRYLRNEPMEPLPVPELPVVHLTTQEIEERLARGEIHRQSRIPMPGLAASERIHSFDEVAIGYDDQSAQAEAARCLACGVCSECMSCTFACGRQAILHDDVERISQIQVGAVILTPGYQVYQAHLSQEYGLGRYPNVVTALQYERMLSASGPTLGHVQRPSDQCSPQRIAFLQCVGSRDQTHDYCSSVCCMYAAKEAIMTIEHARAVARQHHELGDVTCQVFFMDTRAFSKGYEEYYRRAEHTYGVKYTRCRLSDVKENPITHNLIVRYAAAYENNLVDIEHLQVVEEEFDMVVLSVGMEISQQVRNLGRNLGVELDNHGFCRTSLNDPLQTSREGIFVAGPFREPKDIPETVIEASGAAACAAKLLSTSRFTLSREREYPPERSMDAEDVRLGVFVCHCGNNIGGYLDVPAVAQYAAGLPNVVYAEDNLYTCSQDTITHIISEVQNRNLNRVIVASCTPLTHEPLFQDAIRQAGLNPHLFEMANIRNQCSWVHSKDYQAATEKAKALVRMAIARSQQLEPLQVVKSSVNQAVLVVGGGAAGMVGSLMLADQGFPVILVERSDRLGGNLNHIRYFVPDDRDFLGNNGAERGAKGVKKPTPQEYLARLVDKVTNHPKIQVQLNTELKRTDGFKGNFTTTLVQKSREFQVQHGVILIATGGVEYRGDVYGYGQHPSILTQLEFEALLDEQPERVRNLRSVVMILCIGPAEKYCSRICCTTALKNALQLKTRRPDCEITILYRDIRTYGFKERVYQQARQAGVRFIHYEFDHKPEVYIDETIKEQKVETLAERKVDALRGRKDEQENIPDDSVRIKVSDPLLKRNFTLEPDLLVLSMPIVPHPESRHLAHQLKLSVDMDGFFQEAHIKLRPVDFNVDGIFMAGLAHYPKFLDETIAQAQAAAARAARLLVQETISSNAQVAQVDPAKCVGCLTCVRICPYEVPKISLSLEGVGKIVGAAFIEPAICHGCGTCAAECPAQAIQLKHHTDSQILSIVEALFQSQYNTA